MDIDKFKQDCNNHRCNRHTFISKLCDTESKQNKCWIKWQAQQEKNKQKAKPMKRNTNVDEEWEELRAEVWTRDQGECQFIKCLTPEEKEKLKGKAPFFAKDMIDCAHIFGKGSNPRMKYILENVSLVNRFAHSLLDTNHDPITGKMCTQEEKDAWWVRIVGRERYDLLVELKRKLTQL